MAYTDISAALNVIHATASNAYQTTVPLATASNIQDVGNAVLSAPPTIRNEFMTNLYNKIGMTLIDSPVVSNPFEFLKKGRMEYGQTIEDLYVGLATSEPYITGMNEGEDTPDPFSIRKLPHQSAFYHTILSRQYHVTRHVSDLRKAFHNGRSMAEFIAGMMNAITSKEHYDDYRATIALIARQIEEAMNPDTEHQGVVHLVTLYNETYNYEEDDPDFLTPETALQSQDFLKFFSNQLKKWSKRLRHLRSDMNIAGVDQVLPQDRQRIMMLEDISVDFETELLAWAYNSGNLQIGGVDEINAWYSIGADAGGTTSPEDIQVKSTFSTAEGAPTKCVALIYDPDMAKIYNKERIASDQENAKGNYWNMFMSVEDIYAASPYKNFVVFLLD